VELIALREKTDVKLCSIVPFHAVPAHFGTFWSSGSIHGTKRHRRHVQVEPYIVPLCANKSRFWISFRTFDPGCANLCRLEPDAEKRKGRKRKRGNWNPKWASLFQLRIYCLLVWQMVGYLQDSCVRWSSKENDSSINRLYRDAASGSISFFLGDSFGFHFGRSFAVEGSDQSESVMLSSVNKEEKIFNYPKRGPWLIADCNLTRVSFFRERIIFGVDFILEVSSRKKSCGFRDLFKKERKKG